MKELEAKKAELTEKLKTLLAEREALDKGSETYGSTLAKSHEEEGKIRSELEFIEIILKGGKMIGEFLERFPDFDHFKTTVFSKAEEAIPRVKSFFSELLSGSKIPETERPVEPEVDEKTLAVYNAIKSFLLAGEDAVALQAMKFKLEQLQRAKSDAVIFYTLDAMKVLLEAGDQKSPMTLFVNLLK